MKAALIAIAALIVTPAAVQAQDGPDLRQLDVAGIPPFAVIRRLPTMGAGSGETIGLYLLWNRSTPEAEPAGVVLRRDGETPSWADSRTCAGLEQAVVRMETLPAPTLDVPVLGRPGAERMVMDGVFYELWTRSSGWDQDVGYGVTYASNVNTALADWIDAVRTAAEPCWSDTAPTAAAD